MQNIHVLAMHHKYLMSVMNEAFVRKYEFVFLSKVGEIFSVLENLHVVTKIRKYIIAIGKKKFMLLVKQN